MRKFKRLSSGVYSYIDKNGRVNIYTPQEFAMLMLQPIWWNRVKRKYFGL